METEVMSFDWGQAMTLSMQVAMGVSLAACAGLRTFVPLLVVGAAGRTGFVPLMDSFDWLSSTPALTVFGLAVLLEIAGDKFPVVDHFLDGVQIFVKPVAGAMLVASVVTELSPLQQTVMAIALGGGTAFGIHLTKANLRLLSTATTGGVGNPVVSAAEDTLTFAGAGIAIFAPAVALLLLGFVITGAWLLGRRLLARRRRGREVAGVA